MKFATALLFSIVIILILSCSNNRKIELNTRKDLKEIRLGESNFYISLPNKFNLEISHGKEGQKSYSFYPLDSLFPSLDIEIDDGQRLGNKIFDWGKIKEKVNSRLLNRSVTWTIFQTETGYFIAQTAGNKIWIEASSKNKTEIDSLITFASTLIVK